MGFDQYHEPPNELSAETRTFARMIMSLIEEADAIDWYEQRMSVEPDAEARAIMEDAQEEEFKHFSMDLEFLIRRKPKWKVVLQAVLFHEGDIVARATLGEQREDLIGSSSSGKANPPTRSSSGQTSAVQVPSSQPPPAQPPAFREIPSLTVGSLMGVPLGE